jgi:putative endonuclease
MSKRSPEPPPWSETAAYVYIVECADGTFYTGWSKDVAARVRVHNAGRGARYTRARRPVRLCYWEECPDRAAAMRRELQIKHLSRARKQALIDSLEQEES